MLQSWLSTILSKTRTWRRPTLSLLWARIFPQYADTPITAQLLSGPSMATQSDTSNWQIVSRPSANDQSKGYVAFSDTQNGLLLQFKQPNSTGNPFATPVYPSIAINQTFSLSLELPLWFSSIISNDSSFPVTFNEPIDRGYVHDFGRRDNLPCARTGGVR